MSASEAATAEAIETLTAEAAMPPLDNFGRLKAHLKEGSLAYSMVKKYTEAETGQASESVKQLLHRRLIEIRTDLASSAD